MPFRATDIVQRGGLAPAVQAPKPMALWMSFMMHRINPSDPRRTTRDPCAFAPGPRCFESRRPPGCGTRHDLQTFDIRREPGGGDDGRVCVEVRVRLRPWRIVIDGEDALNVREETPRGDDSAQFLKRQTQPLIGPDMQHAGGAAGGKTLNDDGIHGVISSGLSKGRRAFVAFFAKGARRFAVLGAEGAREAGEVPVAEALGNIGHRRILAHQCIGGLEQTNPAFSADRRPACGSCSSDRSLPASYAAGFCESC